MEEDDKQLIYDLRQTYAKLCGFLLEQIMYAKQNKDFPKYFSLIEDLETIIEQKLTDKEIKEYMQLKNEVHKHISEHREAFTGISKDPESVYHVLTILRKLEKHVNKLMETHKMFGSKDDDEGL
jgi:hypothetical protein